MDDSIRAALRRLDDAVDSGDLARVCRIHRIVLFVVFGSALLAEAEPTDLDVAVRFEEPTPSPDVLAVLDDLYRLAGTEKIDLMVLNQAGAVARERALVRGRPLHESSAGNFANAQIAAIMERLDTDHFRRLELELMTG